MRKEEQLREEGIIHHFKTDACSVSLELSETARKQSAAYVVVQIRQTMTGSVNKNPRTKHVPREQSAAGPGRSNCVTKQLSRCAHCGVITEHDGHVNRNERTALLMACSEHLGEI